MSVFLTRNLCKCVKTARLEGVLENILRVTRAWFATKQTLDG